MFEFIGHIFYTTLYQPLFNLLVFLYVYIPGQDFGVAIVFLTIIIRLLIYPISVGAVKSQKRLQELQPKLQEIQKKYKNDRQQQGIETLNLYKSEKVNPFAGILLVFIQLPILICLYQVFLKGLEVSELVHLYPFISNPGQIHSMSLGFVDLSQANLVLAFFAGIVQFFQTKMLIPKSTAKDKAKEADVAQMMQKNMLYFMPIITVIILINLPSALGLYWTVSGLFSIIQQYFIIKKNKTEEIKN